VPAGVVASLIAIRIWNRRGQATKAFLASCVYLCFMLGGACWGLYPTLLPATGNSGADITLNRALSGPHTLSRGLAWWLFGMALAVGYVVFVYSRFKGKVDLGSKGH
jgi:cytochrome d ubiquinol oxidase subunit II